MLCFSGSWKAASRPCPSQAMSHASATSMHRKFGNTFQLIMSAPHRAGTRGGSPRVRAQRKLNKQSSSRTPEQDASVAQNDEVCKVLSQALGLSFARDSGPLIHWAAHSCSAVRMRSRCKVAQAARAAEPCIVRISIKLLTVGIDSNSMNYASILF